MALRDFFENYKKQQILNNGELYMFDTKLTKEQHEKIKSEFEKINESEKDLKLDENNKQVIENKVITKDMICDEELTKIINLKLKSN